MPRASAPDPPLKDAGPRVDPARDRDLARDGWSRRFIGAPPRLQEMADLYRSIGLEVHLEPVTDECLPEGCAGCRLATSLFRIIYTRRPT